MERCGLFCLVFIAEDYHCGYTCFIRMAELSLSELYGNQVSLGEQTPRLDSWSLEIRVEYWWIILHQYSKVGSSLSWCAGSGKTVKKLISRSLKSDQYMILSLFIKIFLCCQICITKFTILIIYTCTIQWH